MSVQRKHRMLCLSGEHIHQDLVSQRIDHYGTYGETWVGTGLVVPCDCPSPVPPRPAPVPPRPPDPEPFVRSDGYLIGWYRASVGGGWFPDVGPGAFTAADAHHYAAGYELIAAVLEWDAEYGEKP